MSVVCYISFKSPCTAIHREMAKIIFNAALACMQEKCPAWKATELWPGCGALSFLSTHYSVVLIVLDGNSVRRA